MKPGHHPRKPSQDPYRNAQRLAFAPLTFQAARIARDNGLLKALEAAGDAGLTPAEAADRAGLPLYAVRVLLESCLSLDLVNALEGRYSLAFAGSLVLNDATVRVNMDFTQDVCYQGAFLLDRSLAEGRPAGLEVFGPWATIYAGLTELPAKARESWFKFDHAYSSSAFPAALPMVLGHGVRRLLDVGGNTGLWARACCRHDPQVEVTILDHPAQLALAAEAARQDGFGDRVHGLAMDLLDHRVPFPPGFDAVWMSQFLDCFPETDVVALLRRGREALAPGGTLFVLETCWDRQPHPAARDAVIATSLYFTCMANGTSRMYHSDDLRACLAQAGLRVAAENQLGYHTLFTCLA